MAFGKRYEYNDPKFGHLLYLLRRIVEIASYAGAVTFIPFLKYVPFSGARKLLNVPEYRQFFEDMVEENAKEYIPNQPRNFIDMYLDNLETVLSSEAEWKKAFNHNDLVRCLCDMFAAGTETSSNTTKWALLFMIQNQDIQHSVQKELDQVIDGGRMISLKDRPNLPYTDATLMEIQRISNVVPLSVPRATTVNARLGGYDVPKGTVVIPNIWGIHHDPAIWDNPEVFHPERFLDDQGCLKRREEFIPFSVGKKHDFNEDHLAGYIHTDHTARSVRVFFFQSFIKVRDCFLFVCCLFSIVCVWGLCGVFLCFSCCFLSGTLYPKI